jgi:hypothetical protein
MIPALKLGKYSKAEIEDRAYSILTKLDLVIKHLNKQTNFLAATTIACHQ